MEIWKDIKGYEGLYQISNYGRVKSLTKTVVREKMGNFEKNEIIMKPTKHKGYFSIMLSKNGVSKMYKVHRLVAEEFVSKYDYKSVAEENRSLIDLDRLEVNHKDEKKSNNNADNLEWCTHLYNMKYGDWKTRRENNADHSYCYKPVNQYDLGGNFIRRWNNMSEPQKELGILRQSISKCCRGERETAKGYIWRYAND